jgi:hypothetical protein
MAKKQTRRCISLSRRDYETAKLEAERRGITLSALVETGLAAIGVPLVDHPKQTLAIAKVAAARRAESMAKRPSREREVLGDTIADAYGFQ